MFAWVGSLSLAERDRRWSTLQDLMARERLDAVVVADEGRCPNARYLTGLVPSDGESLWVVFPREGTPVAIRRLAPEPSSPGSWAPQVVEPASTYGETAVDLLVPRFRRQGRGRVGVVANSANLAGLHAGVAAATGAETLDVTAWLQALRARKSGEELALLTESARVLDGAFTAMNTAIQPGMRAHELWSVGVGAIIRQTGELPLTSRWASAARPRAPARPAHGLLPEGSVAIAEFEAGRHGYATRAIHAMGIGWTGPAIVELYGWVGELWLRGLGQVHPGARGRQLQAELRARTGRLARTSGVRGAAAWFTIRGGGLGSDLPELRGPAVGADLDALSFEPGAVFSLGVWLRTNVDGRQYLVGWEDPVAVTASGVERLGAREPGRPGIGG
jgi:Xaa-Pro aminopeptidase